MEIGRLLFMSYLKPYPCQPWPKYDVCAVRFVLSRILLRPDVLLYHHKTLATCRNPYSRVWNQFNINR